MTVSFPNGDNHHIIRSENNLFRLQGLQRGLIGFNLLVFGLLPRTNSTEDVSATQRFQDFFIGWFMNPFTFGDYPDIMKKNAGPRLPSFTQKESNLVRGSIDFLGINFYYTFYVTNSPSSLPMHNRDYLADISAEIERMYTNDSSTNVVPITPGVFLGILDSLRDAYGNVPIYIHENGQQTPQNSSLDDWPRVNYLDAYIRSLVVALGSGLNVKGYFVWSFLDAFELLVGYESSYGLYYVDRNDPNLRRQPKLSAEWYSNFLKGKLMDPKITKETEKNASVLSYNPSLLCATETNQNTFDIQSE
ncbi:hypothetical protein VNO80_07367 [Phaseolus coccineus]|uniref:Beta-glucosidase n=1 Tax=Phaseolus coccineus TaxID=3886 RepID=A0AAN9NK16_PHACN